MENKVLLPGEGRILNVIGDHVVVRLSGEETDGAFSLIEQTSEPGMGIPLHTHDNEDELFFVMKGTMQFQIGDQIIEAPEGTTAWLPRGLPHSFKAIGDTPATASVTILPAGMEKMLGELGALPPGPSEMEKVLAICERYGVRFK